MQHSQIELYRYKGHFLSLKLIRELPNIEYCYINKTSQNIMTSTDKKTGRIQIQLRQKNGHIDDS